MITPRKFRSLDYRTRVRKARRIVMELRIRLRNGVALPLGTKELIEACAELDYQHPEAGNAARELRLLSDIMSGGAEHLNERLLERCVAELELLTGATPADWDLLDPAGVSTPETTVRSVNGDIRLYLEDLRSPFNVGSICRSAAAFGVSQVYLSPDCTATDHPRARRSAMGAMEILHTERQSLDELLSLHPQPTLIALETDGIPIHEFTFPAQGCLLLGNEELGLGAHALALAGENRLSIPAYGRKATLNVGVAAGIALSWWRAALESAAPDYE